MFADHLCGVFRSANARSHIPATLLLYLKAREGEGITNLLHRTGGEKTDRENRFCIIMDTVAATANNNLTGFGFVK